MRRYREPGDGRERHDSAATTPSALRDPAAFAGEWAHQHPIAKVGAHEVTSVFSWFLTILNGG
jgi:hypothetical protein